MTLTLKKRPRRLRPLHRAPPFIVLAASILTFIAGGIAKAAADAPPSAVMIIDSSNSMAAIGPDGRTKLDAARTMMTAVLAGWPSETRLAVMAYGHRHQSDCTDIETLVDMGPPSLARIAGKLAALHARGKTPISESLRRAAAMLPDSGGTIVPVSDGIETCTADPCAVAQELKRVQAKLIIHIVGFGVTRKEAEQLRCIVDKGGGKYFNAEDAPALATALTDVASAIKATDSVSSSPSPSPTPPPLSGVGF